MMKARRAKTGLWLLGLGALAAAGGCATGRSAGRDDAERPAREVVMDPLHIGLQPDSELGLTDFDAATLFHEGLRLQQAERLDRALLFYDRLLEQFPAARHRSAAAYNAGRCLETLGRPAEAARRYRLIVDGMPHSQDWIAAVFRLAGVLEQLGRYRPAAEVLQRLLDRRPLRPGDRMDGLVRLGEVFIAAGRLTEAEVVLLRALRHFRTVEREAYLDPEPAARAQFRLAELAGGRFLAAPLRLPEQQMRRDLEHKARLLLDTQAAYLRAMRWGDPHWATAAGYRIGKLYIELHTALEAAPVPPELDAAEAAVYRELLHDRLEVLLRKALRIFERTLQLAERSRADNSWTRAARNEMRRIEREVLNGGGKAEASEPRSPARPDSAPPDQS
jgi:tetratricopeptide (TPR) repeat protein